jgi:hypothetical protein
MAQSNLPVCQGEKGMWINCFDTLIYPNGGEYVGEFKDNVFSGQGTYTFAGGNKYVGEWRGFERRRIGYQCGGAKGSQSVA